MNGNFGLAQLKPYLIPIIAVVFIVIIVPLVFLPSLGSLQTNMATLTTKQQTLTQATAKATQLSSLNSSVQKTLLDDKVEPALPSAADPSGVLGTMEQVAVASGVSTQQVSFSAAAPNAAPAAGSAAPAGGGAVAVNLSVKGAYANIVTFLTQAETVARVINIDSLHIIPASAGDTNLVATVSVTAPYQPVPTDLGAVEDPLPPDLTQSMAATVDKISALHAASYAPTNPVIITGKDSPF